MKEEVLHYIWKQRYFELRDLRTTTGAALKILDFGIPNKDAGPDFLNAVLKIGGVKWHGHIEIHVYSSAWYLHQHHEDLNYESVILHVVWTEDQPIKIKGGHLLPCLVLKDRVADSLLSKYQKLANNKDSIPCFSFISGIEASVWRSEIQVMAVDRLERKRKRIQEALEYTQYDWETVLYQMLARNMGFYVNSEAFLDLAQRTPLSLISKYRTSLVRLEALLFGQAGLLTMQEADDYVQELLKEYNFLKHKHQLVPMRGNQWKFLRLRPANFPTIRIAQFAKILFQTHHLFSKSLALKEVGEIENMLEVQPGPYWYNHFIFGKESKDRHKKIGKRACQLILINTIAPLLYTYGHLRGQLHYKERAISFLKALPPEENSIIQHWSKLGIVAEHAWETQGLIALWNEKCKKKHCTSCAIGKTIIN
jgi:hypothetical protein